MIENLDLKLNGTIPINRKELFILVNSYGRSDDFYTNDNINIRKSKSKECYPLENLNVSEITDLSYIFYRSPYNGDLSKWNISKAINLREMFSFSLFNNDSLKDWDVSNVKNMYSLFYKSNFNGDISDWNIYNVLNIKFSFSYCPFDGNISKWKFNPNVSSEDILFNNKAFAKKYNDKESIPNISELFLDWFEANKNKIASLNVTKEELVTIDDYLISFNKDINEIK